jgi:hypothetical protein
VAARAADRMAANAGPLQAPLEELLRSVSALSDEVARLERNCETLEDYHKDLLELCQVWSQWLARAGAVRAERDKRRADD